MPVYHPFVHLLFIGIIALFPVINPVGSAFIITPYFSHLSKAEKRKAVGRITLYAFFICTVSLFAGHWILELFGISIPVIQLAGGIMICKMGWEFLSSDKQEKDPAADAEKQAKLSGYQNIEDKLFYPITFPVTTGAGTISVLFTLSAHSASPDMKNYYLNTGAILLSIVFMCLLIYIFYLNTKTLIDYLGSNGEKIVNRITAFLIFCVGLQIAVTGIKSLFKI
ncbi:MAG: MarC family protein [Mucilaginibacter sp.]|uniref:MarC family protein n=1 Tax=Mucilaginibacter sp. TaxID=1882438 RepID=UPI0031AC5020